MKKIQTQLKGVAKALGTLLAKVEALSEQLEKEQAAPAKTAKKTRKAPAKSRAVKAKAPRAKAAAKAPARKAAAKKPAAKKPAAAKSAAADKGTVLDSVLDVIKRAKNGASIDMLKKKTALQPRQLSNALYKLTKKELIEARSRGIYFKK